MKEQDIQTKIMRHFEKKGYFCINLTITNVKGIPDLVALKPDDVIFIEVKKKTGVVSGMQKYIIKKLKKLGFKCYVWTDVNENFDYGENKKTSYF